MKTLNERFYNFLKISVTVALILLFAASFVVLFMTKMSSVQINISVLMALALAACIGILCARIKTNYKICLILMVAFLIRLIWVLSINTVLVSDYHTMYCSATAFLAGNKGAFVDFGYMARYPHLVPMTLYMMGMLKLFGGNALIAMKCVSLLLSVVTVYLVYALSAYYVKKPSVRLIAMSIAAIYPSFVSFSSTFCTEQIAIPLFLVTVILFNKSVKKSEEYSGKKNLGFLICGIILCLSNLFRGVGLVFLIAFSLYIFCFMHSKKIISFVKLVSGYLLTTVLISGILMGTSVIEQPLWKGKEPTVVTLMLKGSNFEHYGTWNEEDANFVGERLGSENLTKDCLDVIKQRITEKTPLEVAGFYGLKFFTQWSIGDCNGSYWATVDTDTPYPYPLPIIFQIIYIFILAASIFIFKSDAKNNSSLAMLMMLLCGFGIMFIVLETQPRYSYVVNWIFIILAAAGTENLMTTNIYNKFKEKIKR